MAFKQNRLVSLLFLFTTLALIPRAAKALWSTMLPTYDLFSILEQTPLTYPKEGLVFARADWKETSSAHLICLDLPGLKKDDINIEVEESRLLRISGERKGEEEEEGDEWHGVERTNGKFWRQFKLSRDADLDHIKAHLEDGVLKITVPKFVTASNRQPKVIDIDEDKNSGQDIEATKADM